MMSLEKTIQNLVDGLNSQKTRKKKITADTLCNFGELGAETPRTIATIFWNTITRGNKR